MIQLNGNVLSRIIRSLSIRTILLVALGMPLVMVKAIADDSTAGNKPIFYASFDNTVTAKGDQNQSIEPALAQGLKFVDGISGRAVYVGGNGDPNAKTAPALEYPADSLLNSSSGTVMFWVRPDWDGGPDNTTTYHLFDAGPSFNLYASLYYGRWEFQQATPDPTKNNRTNLFIRFPRSTWRKGDWKQIAMQWDSSGWTRFYINGLPFGEGFTDGGKRMVKAALIFDKFRTFGVGSIVDGVSGKPQRANAAFADLKIFNQPLSEDDISAAYRGVVPVDLVVERRFFRAGEPDQVQMDVWPGGQMTRPAVGKDVPVPINVDLDLKVIRESDQSVVTQSDEKLKLRGLKSVTVPLTGMDVGRYRLVCGINYKNYHTQSSFPLYCYQQEPAPAASSDPVQLGDPIVTVDCGSDNPPPIADVGHRVDVDLSSPSNEPPPITEGATKIVTQEGLGTYREGSSVHGARFAYVLDFSQVKTPLQGQPMMLEVYWPDDKPRSMGLYLYPDTKNKQPVGELLQGGLQSGDEYALSGKMQVARYLIYPWRDKYLLEARTMAEGYPAVLSKIVVRPVLGGRLPKLAIQTPKGLPERSFGHLDENQTPEAIFTQAMDASMEEREAKSVEMLMDYMDYTGQNVFSWDFMRYSDVEYDLPNSGSTEYRGLLCGIGARDLLLDMFARRGMKLIAIIDATTIPETKAPDQIEEKTRQGYYQLDKNGNHVSGFAAANLGNPLNPDYQRQFFAHLDEILRRFGTHPALAGIDLWHGDWQISDLDTGYDDLTVKLFEKETGIAVPSGAGNIYNQRYHFLTGPMRKEWVAWRARKNTEFIRRIAEHIHAVNPKLTLSVPLCGGFSNNHDVPMQGGDDEISAINLDFRQYYLENESLDVQALENLPGVIIAPFRFPTVAQWQLHWNHAYRNSNELMADMKRQGDLFLHQPVRHADAFNSYFETAVHSLKMDEFNCYFEAADVKAHDRFFLKEFAQEMVSTDPEQILIGGQTLGTNGRDEETREFTQAFRALPSGAYTDIPNLSDPVCGRYLSTQQGAYVYLQNQIDTALDVALQLPTGTVLQNLSSGQDVQENKGTYAVTLKPFELMALKTDKDVASVGAQKVALSDDLLQRYKTILADYKNKVDILEKDGTDISLYQSQLNAFQNALDEGRIAEAARLSRLILFLQMDKAIADADKGYLKTQKEMIASGHYAVACGRDDFYPASSGVLFFPDIKYRAGGYGYFGSHDACMRPTDKLQTSLDKGLFLNEVYAVESYRFTVPNGKYTVRLYNAIMYEPEQKAGARVMNLDIQGKRVWNDMDLFLALHQDPNGALMSEFKDVEVKDGVLRLDWSPTLNLGAYGLGWCNAIEIIPDSVK